MDYEIKDWITIIGISLTLLISLISLYFSIYNSKKTLFINSITSSRIKWISILRENISEFCGLNMHYAITTLSEIENQKILLQIDKLSFKIKLQLNRDDDFDKKIIQKMNKIPLLASEKNKLSNLEFEINELIDFTQDLLKLEWEGAKLESMKGILSKKEKNELYEKHLKIEKASR